MDISSLGLKIINENNKNYLFDKHTYKKICVLDSLDEKDVIGIINKYKNEIESYRKKLDQEKIKHYNDLLLDSNFYFDLQDNIFYIKFTNGKQKFLDKLELESYNFDYLRMLAL